jgi:hypothetical protein
MQDERLRLWAYDCMPRRSGGFYGRDEGGEPWLRLARDLPLQCDVMVREIPMDDTETVYIVAGHVLFTSQEEGASRCMNGWPAHS